jgi:DNA repair protein RadA/Sms
MTIMNMNLQGQPEINMNTNILDIVIPQQMEENIPTGIPHINHLFAGDGITPSTSSLVTGIPGSGKTTMMLQLADSITASGNVAIYNTGEESLFQVRRVVRRLGLRHGFIPGYERSVQEIIERANEISAANPEKKVFLFVDSLQCVELDRATGQRGRDPNQGNREVRVTERLTTWAKETFNVCMIIGQVKKDGQFAGKQAILHTVDCHLHIDQDRDRRSETYGERTATIEKNRFGNSGIYYTYEINNSGVRFETA